MNRLSAIPPEERNFYDSVLLRLWQMHGEFWKFRLAMSAVRDLRGMLMGETDPQKNANAGFFAPQMRIELGQRIKELHIGWFARGVHWLMLQDGGIGDRDLLPCKPSALYGRMIRIFSKT